ncbi:bacterioferritin [Celeribacter indicus]|uniref:Bacterioferritin n=1 Tax=Celeribacter indicus TaxID=1208324 RepID=A0A0B5DP69_9RHOB|nr:bacterioferritin [Celeribacter indicus]AJE45373.1 bacterioferritin [Celeribacter indicus]SDX00198.1 bacterioferritin [Celeribacter indicus]
MSNETTLKHLNTALQMELTATHQYQLHAHVLEDWGLDLLAAKMREESSEETGHSNRFLERIFELDGEPEMAFNATPKVAKSLRNMFEMDMADEKEAIDFYTKAAKDAFAADDLKTKRLFESIAIDEVGHKNWLDLQLSLIERIGEQNYASKYVSGADAGED